MIKQIIVMRTDLNMRKGKMCAQAAHASMKVILDLMETIRNKEVQIDEPGYVMMLHLYEEPELEQWLSGKFTKICVSVNSEQELLDIYNKAKNSDILCSLITDAGLTEFHNVPTITCAAIGPDTAEKLDPLTGHLKLL